MNLADLFQWLGIAVLLLTLATIGGSAAVSIWRWRNERRVFQTTLSLVQEQIAAAAALRQRRQQESHSWNGTRKFVVARKTREIPDVFSFYLRPHDNKSLPAFAPGQYATFHLHLAGVAQPVVRCYSLSDCYRGDNTYRVTIKRALAPKDQPDAPPGVASSFLCDRVDEGDILDIEAPRGNFVADVASMRPLVLVAGGIGITPLLTMLHSVFSVAPDRQVWFFLAVRTFEEFIFRRELERAVAEHLNLRLFVYLSRETASRQHAAATPRAALTETQHRALQPTLTSEDGQYDFVLKGNNMTIGRLPPCEIRIPHPMVSGKHARLFRKEKGWYLEDLNSTNGTLHEKNNVTGTVALKNNDQIEFGAVAFRFLSPLDAGDTGDVAPSSRNYEHRFGRLSPEEMLRQLPSSNFSFYICGPGRMTSDFVNALEGKGVPRRDIHFEPFGPASVPTAPEASSQTTTLIQIEFAKSGKSIPWDSAAGNLLALAEQHGIAIPAACRTGNCGSCLVAVRSGAIDHLVHTGANVDAGSCLACIAVPTENLTIDA